MYRVDPIDDERFYHDERARAEFMLADRTDDRKAAERHRDLARLHIARRGWSDFVTRIATGPRDSAAPICRTDKEA
jgi:hypothetical protein